MRRGDRVAALNGVRFATLRAFRVGGGGVRVGRRELRAVIAGLPLRQTWLQQFMSGADAAATEDDDIAAALLVSFFHRPAGRVLLPLTFRANPAHNLTRSPEHIV